LQDCSAAIENLPARRACSGLGRLLVGRAPAPARIEALTKILRLPDKILPVPASLWAGPPETQPPRTRFSSAHVHDESWDQPLNNNDR